MYIYGRLCPKVAIATKQQSCNKLIKALAVSSWRKDEKTLLATYKDADKEATSLPKNGPQSTAAGNLLMSPLHNTAQRSIYATVNLIRREKRGQTAA